MPIWYEGVIDEAKAVRNSIGIFDVSHMGRIFITGKDAESFLNYLTTNDVAKLSPLRCHYTVMCNEKGGIVDDFVLTRLEEQKFLIVVNAGNRRKVVLWLKSHISDYDASIEEVSDTVAMIAVQGPASRTVIQGLINKDVMEIPRFGCGWIKIDRVDCIATGTGYTGEDGFEIFVLDSTVEESERALKVWNAILQRGRKFNVKPCGLGARNILRLEAGMCLYGNDIDESTTPLEVRIGFVVKEDKQGDFIGSAAIKRQRSEGVKRVRIGLVVRGKGIPREDYPIIKDGEVIGRVSSGTFSPTLNKGIAMGYIPPEYSKRNSLLEIEIRSKNVEAEVVGFPFYDKSMYGWQRRN